MVGRIVLTVGLLCLCALLNGCNRSDSATANREKAGTIVVYTALDRQFSEPILRRFSERTGSDVQAVYDTESTKTIGLVNRIRAEVGRPRCDVFWNNEIVNTLRLKSEGLLAPCWPVQAENYPEQYRDPEGCWYGFAARARILAVNTTLVKPEQMPSSFSDLADPRWKGRAGMAKPLFGTTASHVACLFAKLGPDPAKELLLRFKHNDIQIMAGNKACAEAVGAGRLALAVTDTDDAMEAQQAGQPVALIFPDSGEESVGTLLLPNTLSVVTGAPNPTGAAKLIDFLLSPEVEQELASGPSAQIPLNGLSKARPNLPGLDAARLMQIRYSDAALQFSAAQEFVQAEFLQ